MSFFPADPPPPDPAEFAPQPQPWWAPPGDELPALFPVSELLAATGNVAVAVIGVRVYSTGAEFLIERRMRRGSMDVRAWQDAQLGFGGHHHHSGSAGFEGRLRFGMVLGDGQQLVVDSLFQRSFGPDAPEGHSLVQTGGNGGGDMSYQRYEDALWLWPLPPAGPLELVMQWPDLGIPESRAVMSGEGMRELAAGVRRLWV